MWRRKELSLNKDVIVLIDGNPTKVPFVEPENKSVGEIKRAQGHVANIQKVQSDFKFRQ